MAGVSDSEGFGNLFYIRKTCKSGLRAVPGTPPGGRDVLLRACRRSGAGGREALTRAPSKSPTVG